MTAARATRRGWRRMEHAVGVENSDAAEVVDSQRSGGRVLSLVCADHASLLGVWIFQRWRRFEVGEPGTSPSAENALANRAPTRDPRMGPPFLDRSEGNLGPVGGKRW